jgi:hypothetical protein
MIALGMPTKGKVDNLQDKDYHVQGHMCIGHLHGLLVACDVFEKAREMMHLSDS